MNLKDLSYLSFLHLGPFTRIRTIFEWTKTCMVPLACVYTGPAELDVFSNG